MTRQKTIHAIAAVAAFIASAINLFTGRFDVLPWSLACFLYAATAFSETP